jgi:small GTP-binding protein
MMENLVELDASTMNKKICMIGSSAVGKTSLVARFVRSIFADKYLTTVGVKIDKKTVRAGGREVTLILWDLNGDDEFQKLQTSYLRGAAGYLLVVDGCRRPTLDTALDLQRRVAATLGDAPFILALNKADLRDDWEVTDAHLAELQARGWRVLETSAKSGLNVEEAFQKLTEMTLA